MTQTISLIVPVYFNEPNLDDSIPQLLDLEAALPGQRFELVFVDDGSGDGSLAKLIEYQQRRPDVIKVVKLTRNFGSMGAINAGLTVATGDCVGWLAADLQDPPSLMVEMIRHWQAGAKAVFAVRAGRHEPILQSLASNMYYALIRLLALPGYPRRGIGFFVVDRQVVGDLLRIREKNTNLLSLVFWLGYSPVMVPYVRPARSKGRSRWTLGKKVKLFIDSFVSFSYAPIRFLSLFGFVVALSAFMYAAGIFFLWAHSGIPVKGYAPLAILLALFSGIQMIMLGILGEYLWRTLDETRRRPDFVIDRIYGAPLPNAGAPTSPETGASTGGLPSLHA